LAGQWLKVEFANVYVVKAFFSALFFVLFILLSVSAAVGFRWGTRPVPDQREGNEVVFVFDLSNSMMADDVAPTRLRRAAILANEVIDSSGTGRFAVVGYKGNASLLLPVTEDTTALQNLLGALHPEMISSPGTDIEAGIRRGAESFSEMFEAHQILVLFTDGEGLSGDPVAAAAALKTEKISIVVVGIGSENPSRIPVRDGEYLLDPEGNVLTTELRRDSLENIAEAADGSLLFAADAGVRDQIIEASLGGGGVSGYEYQSTDRFRFFLGLALLCLTISAGVRLIRWGNTF
jgi:Ca-activated chloride channel family protein